MATHPPQPVRVALILEAATGGARAHLLQLLNGLNTPDFEFTVVVSAERDRAVRADMRALESRGIRVFELPMVRRVAPCRDIVAGKRLRRIFRDVQPQIIHTHASKAGGLGRLAARAASGARVIHTPHTLHFQGRKGIARCVYREAERLLLGRKDVLICLTEAQRRLAKEELHAPEEKLRVIPNGVDCDHFRPDGNAAEARRTLGLPESGPVVAQIGRLVPQKRFDRFLRAAALAADALPEARFLIVGEGPLLRPLQRHALELGLGDRLTWRPGFPDPRPAYSAADVVSLTSSYEGLPYVLLEAMAMATPVVASDRIGCEELVRSRTGLLADPARPESFADALLSLMRDEGRRREMGTAAREHVCESFSLDRFLDAMHALYLDSAPTRPV